MLIKNYREVDRGCIKAKFSLYIKNLEMTIHDICYMQKGGARWLNMPSFTYQVKDETHRYYVISFEKERKKKLEKACFERIDRGDYETFTSSQEENYIPCIEEKNKWI